MTDLLMTSRPSPAGAASDPRDRDADWRPVCAFADLEGDCGKRVQLEGLPPLAVFRLDDDVFVTDDTCTHGDASLCDGFVEDGQVECPWHAGKFDIRSGAATAFPAVAPIRVYRTRVVDGQVSIVVD